jgi:hypothetical protein
VKICNLLPFVTTVHCVLVSGKEVMSSVGETNVYVAEVL